MSTEPARIALRFLTRLPVPVADASPANVGLSLCWYPAVGLLLGAVTAGLGMAFGGAHPLLGAALAVTGLATLSGGLHLDGLADTADAWVGGLGDRERTLAIMKDPSCGPAGVTAIVGALVLKLAAAAALLTAGAWWGLVLAPMLARAAVPLLFMTTPYVRPAGMGTALAEHLPPGPVRLVLVGAALICLPAGIVGLASLLTATIALVLLRAAFVRRLGGITGDTAGGAIEVVETAALVAAAAAA